MDLYSRRIIAWRVSDSLEAKWVVECVKEAKRKRPSNKAILHSDRAHSISAKPITECLVISITVIPERPPPGKMHVWNHFAL